VARERPSGTHAISSVSTQLRIDRILVTRFTGVVDGPLAAQALADLRLRLLREDVPAEQRPVLWVVDAMAVSGFKGMEIHRPGGEILEMVKNRIGPSMILATTNPLVRTFAAGITLGRVKLKAVDSMAAVDREIADLRRRGELD
jgi:hypothetical protein